MPENNGAAEQDVQYHRETPVDPMPESQPLSAEASTDVEQMIFKGPTRGLVVEVSPKGFDYHFLDVDGTQLPDTGDIRPGTFEVETRAAIVEVLEYRDQNSFTVIGARENGRLTQIIGGVDRSRGDSRVTRFCGGIGIANTDEFDGTVEVRGGAVSLVEISGPRSTRPAEVSPFINSESNETYPSVRYEPVNGVLTIINGPSEGNTVMAPEIGECPTTLSSEQALGFMKRLADLNDLNPLIPPFDLEK
jgi:hypothetical protein